MRTFLEFMACVATAAAIVLCMTVVCGCAGLAEVTASSVAPAFDPDTFVLEQDRCSMGFEICEEDYTGACVGLLLELTRFDLEIEGGEVITCLGSYVEPTWFDGSRNEWLSASKHSDPRCEAEMERLAALPD